MKRNLLASLLLSVSMVLGASSVASAEIWVEGTRMLNPENVTYIGSSLKEDSGAWITSFDAKYNKKKNMNLNGKAKKVDPKKDQLLDMRVKPISNVNASFNLYRLRDLTKTDSESMGKGFKDSYSTASHNGYTLNIEIYDRLAMQYKYKNWKGVLDQFVKDVAQYDGPKLKKDNWKYYYMTNNAFFAYQEYSTTEAYLVIEDISGNCYVVYGSPEYVEYMIYTFECTDGNIPYKYTRDANGSYQQRLFVHDENNKEYIIDQSRYIYNNYAPNNNGINGKGGWL